MSDDDYGAAVAADDDDDDTDDDGGNNDSAQTLTLCLHCSYCAPEQARAQVGFTTGISGSSSYGAAADMCALGMICVMGRGQILTRVIRYSLGIIFFELLRGNIRLVAHHS